MLFNLKKYGGYIVKSYHVIYDGKTERNLEIRVAELAEK